MILIDDKWIIYPCTHTRPVCVHTSVYAYIPTYIHTYKSSNPPTLSSPLPSGDRCSIGLKSQVAAGSTLSSGTHLGPLSSSHELDDAEAHYRHYCRPSFQPPPGYLILLVGCPVLLSVLAVGLVPWYFALLFMVRAYVRTCVVLCIVV